MRAEITGCAIAHKFAGINNTPDARAEPRVTLNVLTCVVVDAAVDEIEPFSCEHGLRAISTALNFENEEGVHHFAG